MKTRLWTITGLLALMIAVPVSLRRETQTVSPRQADDKLIVITPHNESIRLEFGEAFASHWKKTTGRTLYVDWRKPGGTSEIRMVLDAGFNAAEEINAKGIGIDVFFGGGEPDFNEQSKKGRLAKLEIFDKHPEWFGENGVIPQTFTGERYFPDDHTWVATCMSQFGICYNPDFLKRLDLPPPTQWSDLGDPRYAGSLALADPTKSGSVARSFELMIQNQIQLEITNRSPDERDAAISDGWDNGLRLLQKLAANARYFTDSAPKIPLDVGQGNASAGMCIDFYGRSFGEELKTAGGSPRIVWTVPHAGTTLSGDPIAVLEGAPHPRIAQAFVEYCLSLEAQNLWFGKAGTPGGPVTRALHRTPVRKDAYTPERLQQSTMPDAHPYQDDGNFTYQKDLTGNAFNTLRNLIKVMCIDSHEEMKSSWQAIREAGMPADALAVFHDVSIISYGIGGKGDPQLDSRDPLVAARRASQLGEWFRKNYRTAEALARVHPKTVSR